jgi:hypothetical protein
VLHSIVFISFGYIICLQQHVISAAAFLILQRRETGSMLQ